MDNKLGQIQISIDIDNQNYFIMTNDDLYINRPALAQNILILQYLKEAVKAMESAIIDNDTPFATTKFF